MGVCNCSIFCYTLCCVHSSIAIILMGNRELIALLNLSSWCLVMVKWLFLAVPWGCVRVVIVVFPDHTHLLLFNIYINTADEVIRFQLFPSFLFPDLCSLTLYILNICKHFCFKQGCNFTHLFCLIEDLMSNKLLNMHQGTFAYKVVVYRINKTDFLMQLILVYFLTFFSIPSCKGL